MTHTFVYLSREYGRGVTVSTNGDVYAVGSFDSICMFYGTRYSSRGNSDAIMCTYDANGTCLWTKYLAGGKGTDIATSVATDASGNVYVVGQFSGTTDFGGIVCTSNGGSDIFILKLDPHGSRIWLRQYGTLENEYPESVTISPLGAVSIFFREKLYVSTRLLIQYDTDGRPYTN